MRWNNPAHRNAAPSGKSIAQGKLQILNLPAEVQTVNVQLEGPENREACLSMADVAERIQRALSTPPGPNSPSA